MKLASQPDQCPRGWEGRNFINSHVGSMQDQNIIKSPLAMTLCEQTLQAVAAVNKPHFVQCPCCPAGQIQTWLCKEQLSSKQIDVPDRQKSDSQRCMIALCKQLWLFYWCTHFNKLNRSVHFWEHVLSSHVWTKLYSSANTVWWPRCCCICLYAIIVMVSLSGLCAFEPKSTAACQLGAQLHTRCLAAQSEKTSLML